MNQIDDLENKIVFMIDEFPIVLENILKDEDERKAVHFLQSNREIRLTPEISRKIQFIYTGSIGLENIATRINSISLVNDLSLLKVKPLKEKEARELITLLLEDIELKLTEIQINKIISKIKYLIPYFIQLIISELNEIYIEEEISELTDENIDLAFDEMIKQRLEIPFFEVLL